MLGRGLIHRSVCPNNVTIVSKYKGHPVECVCIWCLKNGYRSLAHRYVHCPRKPIGVHHCPYCYRVCGLVEFHTIYACKNAPSLAEYSVGVSNSKKNPHINEMSLKDQIFHLEIKIVRCQETIMGCNVKSEDNKLRAKLHTLYGTEETLVNELRMLELKTLSKGVPSMSSAPSTSSLSVAPSSSSSSKGSLPSSSSSTAATSGPGPGHGAGGGGSGGRGGGAGGNPDSEKYQTLFENDLLFGEMEEIAYDESEGGYDEDGAVSPRNRHDQPEWMEREEVGRDGREGSLREATATGRHSPSRKRKHVEQDASVRPKHQRLFDDDKGILPPPPSLCAILLLSLSFDRSQRALTVAAAV
jgi:hypothetical protein